jgi:hypothetical protein
MHIYVEFLSAINDSFITAMLCNDLVNRRVFNEILDILEYFYFGKFSIHHNMI